MNPFLLTPTGTEEVLLKLVVLAVVLIISFLTGRHAALRFSGERRKVILIFICLMTVLSVLLLSFFGLTPAAYQGLSLFLLLLYASYEDILTTAPKLDIIYT